MARIKVQGLDRLKRRCRSLSRGVAAATEAGVADGAESIAADARGRAAVDTGEMRDAIKVATSPRLGSRSEAAVVVDDQAVEGDYHPAYVEFGTSEMAPRPFLTPAAEAGRGAVRRKVASRVARVLNRKGG